ncbi:MAG TPA: hypothetical protein H9716_09140 [Candidatus Enterocloster faecavium]|uniref:Uncharacterized protein n=1 Tax=Candidatus Enterocloster faecavium TaxID=2838560 RepID=A0A9D2L8U4_9FIRM|nr:hypothetical protein [Candidatus Enterocloster faecavium]
MEIEKKWMPCTGSGRKHLRKPIPGKSSGEFSGKVTSNGGCHEKAILRYRWAGILTDAGPKRTDQSKG